MTDKDFKKLIKPLSNREQQILLARRGMETIFSLRSNQVLWSFTDLAHAMNLSRQRVQQIEKRAFEKLGVDKNIYGLRNVKRKS